MSKGIVAPRRNRTVITVGGADADIPGYHGQAIQQALDLAKAGGGGKVALSPGTYDIMAPVRLHDGITLCGAGDATILRKSDGFETKFTADADYGELQAQVEDASGFAVGMAIELHDDISRSGWDVSTAVITAIDGNTIYFDNYLQRDYIAAENGRISNACSIIECVNVHAAVISSLVVEGNKQTNQYMNGCRGGAIYLHKAAHCTLEDLKVFNYHGDGISWQITENITLRRCEVSGVTNSGLHPGSGSMVTVIDQCNAHDNGLDGIFVCWRVQQGRFTNNTFHHNGRYGICIGHKDSDNLFQSNHIHHNAEAGIYVRKEIPSNGAHRNTYTGNTIEDNGSGKSGFGIYLNGSTEGNVIENNVIRDNGANVQRTGIYVHTDVTGLKLSGNQISGHMNGDVVNHS